MRIGFQLSDAEEVEPEIGAAIPDDAGTWHEGVVRLLDGIVVEICHCIWVLLGDPGFDEKYLLK
jgi:hypothetical protein